MKLMTLGMLAAALAFQEASPLFVTGEPTASRWPLSGPANVEDETELNLRARRVIRRWDVNRKLFVETLEDSVRRTYVVATGKRFDGHLKPSTAGRYAVALSTEDKLLHTEWLSLGMIEKLFARGPGDVKAILEIVDKAGTFLDEVERIVGGRAGNSEKDRQDYLRRVSEPARKLDELYDATDFTGTLGVLRDVYFNVRNVQIWQDKPLPPPAMDDPPRKQKKIFTDMDLTIEMLRKSLASIPEVLSNENKVSTTMILERLIAQAGKDERRLESVRSTARAASKLAEGAPVPDKDLVRLLDLASDRATDPAEIGPQLRTAGQAFLVQ